MEEFLRIHGLWAVYLGMWLEGETILVLAGFLASQGLLHRWEVLAVAILGALSVDLFAFFAGRHASRFHRLQKLLASGCEEGTWRARLGDSWAVFFLIRFIYGARTPYMFYVGTRKMPWARFLAYEVGPVVAWCSVWLFFGHAIGNLLLAAYGKIHHHERGWIMAAMAVTTLAFFLILTMHRERKMRGRIALKAEEDGADSARTP